MNAFDVYSKLGTPGNLQRHMLRVASLAAIILDSWIGGHIDKKSVIVACLFHDIAKPLTFDMSKQKHFVDSDKELELLLIHHDKLILDYGTEEHPALIKIFREFGLSKQSQRIVNNLEWSLADELLTQGDIASLIPIYADMRISPTGLLSIEERILELNKRAPVKNLEERISSARSLEAEVRKNTGIDLYTITDNQVTKKVETLVQTEVN